METRAEFEPPKKVPPELTKLDNGDYAGCRWEELPRALTDFCDSLYRDLFQVSRRAFSV
jgi:hypothetical protein